MRSTVGARPSTVLATYRIPPRIASPMANAARDRRLAPRTGGLSLAQAGGKELKLVPVLGHCPSGDRHALGGQPVGDLLVGERLEGGLCLDHPANLVLD